MLLKSENNTMISLHFLLVVLCFLCCSIEVNGNTCTKKAVANKVDPEVRRSQRRGSKNKADIKWDYPSEILQDPTCYKLPASKLEMKEGNKPWVTIQDRVKLEAKLLKWTVDVKPCLNYDFRIKLFTDDDRPQETTTIASLPALNGEEVLNSGYKPEPPADFKATKITESSTTLTWEKSDCARSYELNYGDQNSDEPITKQLGDKSLATITGLQPCKTYVTHIYSALGEKYGEIEKQFSTKPDLNIRDKFQLEAISTSDSVQLSWPSWKNVSCIQEYKIKTCLTSTTCCIKEATVNKTVNPMMIFKETGLKDKQSYTFRIKPIFKGLDLKVKEKVVLVGQIPIFAKKVEEGAVNFPGKVSHDSCPISFEFEKKKDEHPTKQSNGSERSSMNSVFFCFIGLILHSFTILLK